MKIKVTSGWLGQMEPSIVERVLDAGKLQRFADAEAVTRLGEEVTCIHGVISGCIRMFVTMNEQAPKFGHVVGPGFWFGEHEILSGGPRIIDMQASGETVLLRLGRREIDQIAKKIPEFWQCLFALAVMNQGVAIGAADDLLIRGSRQRLVAVLLRLAGFRNAFQSTPPVTRIPATWNELSEASNLSRSKVASLLSEFARQGLIRTEKGSIMILSFEGLQHFLLE